MTRLTNKNANKSMITETLVKQWAEDVVREAISTQARDLETHLKNIHQRLVALEKKR